MSNSVTTVTAPITTITSPAIVITAAATIVGNGGIVTTLCTSVGIAQNLTLDVIELFPNPVKDICTITYPFNNAALIVYDLTGRALLHQPFNETSTINVAQLKAGMYMVEVRDKEGKSVKGKVVKE